MKDTVKVPLLIRPIVALAFMAFFLIMLAFTMAMGAISIVIGCLAFVVTGNLTVSYK